MKIKNENNIIGFVYMIISPTGRIYVGSTYDVDLRCLKYIRNDCKGQTKLYNSLEKYGWNNHIFEIVWKGDINDMLKYETMIGTYYEVLDTKKGLNCRLPKSGEIYQCISEETRQKMSESQRGRVHSQNTKDKQSLSKIGKPRSQKTKDKISNSHIGKKLSEEIRRKMSLNHGKEILQYDLDGNFIREWRNGAIAGKAVNRSSEAILACCRGIQRTSAGFIWKYK